MELDVLYNKQRFMNLCKKYVTRDGIDELLEYLDNTDFFEAPASSKFHLACKGGLCQHSLNVLTRLVREYKFESESEGSQLKPLSEVYESLVIISLFHDICKADFYKEDTRNVKKNGVWVQVPFYSIDEKLSLGHGEKSVILIMRHMKLNDEEIVAINSHMGFSDARVKGGDYSVVNQWEKYPLALLLHIADMKASKIDEKKDDE